MLESNFCLAVEINDRSFTGARVVANLGETDADLLRGSEQPMLLASSCPGSGYAVEIRKSWWVRVYRRGHDDT